MPDQTTNEFESVANPTPEATILQTARRGQRVTTAFMADLAEDEGVGEPVAALQATMTRVSADIARIASSRSPTGLTDDARKATAALAAPFKAVQAATARAMVEVDKSLADMLTPKFPEGSTPATRAETRGYVRSLSLGKKIEAATSDPLVAASIIEGGASLSEVPPDVFDRVAREAAIGQFAEILARQHNFKTEPTPTSPIGGAPDMKAARDAATARLDHLEARKALLERVPALLVSILDAVAIMCEESREAAFARLSR